MGLHQTSEQIESLMKRNHQWWRPVFTGLHRLGAYIVDWRKRKGFDTGWKNVPEKLMLVVTELSEAMEAYRHWLVDQHNEELGPKRVANFREELADAMIRLLDLTHSLGIDIGNEIRAKMEVNEARPERHGKGC